MSSEQMIRYLLSHQMLENPLPWRVERDWSFEVTASNGHIIAKCQKHEEAEEIIETAEKIDQEVKAMADEFVINL